MKPAAVGWWGTMRGPFLLLTPACMVLGLACAWVARAPGQGAADLAGPAVAALLAALCAHISVNMLSKILNITAAVIQLASDPLRPSGG